MKIVVCVKQVPATNEVSIDPETKRLIREGVKAVMNPFDLYAVEQAVLLGEQLGCRTVALSMGPPQAEASLREALAMGVDEGVLLTDRAFAGSDTWATSYALSCAIRHLGEVGLVICGKQAADGDTAQVGPGIAAHLQWPQTPYVAQVLAASVKQLTLLRMHEDGCDRVQVDLPAVITVVKDVNQPRVPTLRKVLASRQAQIAVLGAAAIGAELALLGLNGSPTRVVKTNPPPPRNSATMVLAGTAEDSARKLVHELRLQSIL